jgi:hypothetical protein
MNRFIGACVVEAFAECDRIEAVMAGLISRGFRGWVLLSR